MDSKDLRFRMINEILAGIKVLKFYAWEPPFENKTNGYRKKELHHVKWANIFTGIGRASYLVTPSLVNFRHSEFLFLNQQFNGACYGAF